MAIEFTYGFKSAVPYDDLLVEPDTDSSISIGQQLLAAGNHTVSEPTIIDDYTREWTLTFPDSAAWTLYKDQVVEGENRTKNDAKGVTYGITGYAVKTPDD
tara:strand:- start:595 stop:897 length:303 start_codon:yes stop_codon:yes gene_type:complete